MGGSTGACSPEARTPWTDRQKLERRGLIARSSNARSSRRENAERDAEREREFCRRENAELDAGRERENLAAEREREFSGASPKLINHGRAGRHTLDLLAYLRNCANAWRPMANLALG